jgi:hypothetical protein
MPENDDNRDSCLRLDIEMMLKLFQCLPPEERGCVMRYTVDVFSEKYPIHRLSPTCNDSGLICDDEFIRRDLSLCSEETMPLYGLCEYLGDYIHLVLGYFFPMVHAVSFFIQPNVFKHIVFTNIEFSHRRA